MTPGLLRKVLTRPRANPERTLIAKPRPPRRYEGEHRDWYLRMRRFGTSDAAARAAIAEHIARHQA